jgi:alpha/beta superfamily hydrolase
VHPTRYYHPTMKVEQPIGRRIDPESGASDEVGFFDNSGVRMFKCIHRPRSTPKSGVLICSPLHAEFLKNYRKEVLLGRLLAARGIAALRFHYRGSGNSEGKSQEITFQSTLEDTFVAADHLLEQTGIRKVALVGTRWGGLMAAAVAQRWEGVPVALWEPIIDSQTYFRDMFRALQIHALKKGTSLSRVESPSERLRREGTVDVLGYRVTNSLLKSAQSRTLLDEMGDKPRPILIIQISNSRKLRSHYVKAVAHWRDRGFPIESHIVGKDEAWWFADRPGQPTQESFGDDALLDTTGGWLEARLAELGG